MDLCLRLIDPLDIVKSFKASLLHIDWMDKKSADAAAEKVHVSAPSNHHDILIAFIIIQQANAIRVKVGFPISPDTRDARSIARYYHLVEVDSSTFFENMLSAASVFSLIV